MDPQIFNFLAVINTALRGKLNKLNNPDWIRIADLARYHNIVPLVYEGCSKYKAFTSAPIELRNKCFASCISQIRGQIYRTQFFMAVYGKLLAAGLKPLVLKGLVCRSLYGNLADHRPSTDEDIYIKREEFDTCRRILEQSGYKMEKLDLTGDNLSKWPVITFYHDSGPKIEVHFCLFEQINDIRSRLNSFFDDPCEDCISLKINGLQVYSMNPTRFYLYLYLHFYKHFITFGVGIRQLLDLLLYGEQYYRDIDWKMVEDSIKSLSADKLYADLLAIGAKYLGSNLKTSLSGSSDSLLLEDIINAGIFGKASKERLIGGKMAIAAQNSGRFRVIDLLLPKKETLMNSYKLTKINRLQQLNLWMRRMFRFIRCNYNLVLLYRSIKLGRRRMRLLKSYKVYNCED